MALAEGRPLVVFRVDPTADRRWEELMTGPRGSLFGSPPWLAALVDTYAFDVQADVLVDSEGLPVAGMAHVEIDDFRGRRIRSLPFCDYLDPVVESFAQWQQLVSPLLALGVPLSLRCLSTEIPLGDERFTRGDVACWQATQLGAPLRDVVAGMHPQARQNIRRAQRNGVSVRFSDRLEDIHSFYSLHREMRKRKYRQLAQPIALFESLWARFSPTGSIVVGLAEHSGEAIAGALYLLWDGVVYYKFGASRSEALHLRPNELLAHESMRYAIEHDCRLYDWGLSDYRQPGLVSFKRKLATLERPITFLRAGPETPHDPVAVCGEDLIGRLTELLTRDDVSDDVTQRAGELLYRFFA